MADLRSLLQDLYDQHGSITPKLVVEQARPLTSPLHGYFPCKADGEWDLEQLAEEGLLTRAQKLIRSVKITFVDPNSGHNQRLNQYLSIQLHQGGRAYKAAADVAADEFTAELFRRDVERDWRALKARADRFGWFRQMVLADIAAENGEPPPNGDDLSEAS